MNQPMKQLSRKTQGGFTITELMLVLGVAAVVMGGAFAGYKVVSENAKDQENMSGIVNLVTSVKNKWQGVGSFAGVTSTAINSAGLVSRPLFWDTTTSTILNGYERTVGFSGTSRNFVAQIDVQPNKCLEFVGAVIGIAYRIDVDTAARTASDAEDGSKTVKPAASGVLDAAKANVQCSGASTVVTAYVK